MHYAHSTEDRDRDRWQRLAEHLANVSREAAARAERFGAGRTAALAGLFHDLGKYAPAFQAYISGNGESPDHATAGAREILALGLRGKDGFAAQLAALCVAGHHTGLPDRVGGEASLDKRLRKALPALDPAWRQEVVPDVAHLFPPGFRGHESGDKRLASFQLALLGRMVFSCLVDADYRDTEAFCAAARGESIDREWPALGGIVNGLIARFNAHMAGIAASAVDTPVNRLRAEIMAQVRAKAAMPPGAFTLTVPTGGGKTLASLGFALDHARHHGLRRIIYAIPFTSIIDQTVDIFEMVLGEGVVLEHHSAIEQGETRESGERDVRDKMRLAMEDWAAPVVVTTNVQLLESLFAARPSRCRKLHSLVDTVIVLDEAQTIPLHVLVPSVVALDELARNYGCSIVLCTATQPALAAPRFEHGFRLEKDRELAPEPTRLQEELKRVTLRRAPAPLTDADLVADLAGTERGLVIVNSRKHALALYRAAKAAGLGGLVHLTTRQTAVDRRRILAAVRAELMAQRSCRVVATSLVEAGVDLDFPRVWRAEAGLDQILQAAGRCNREGRQRHEDSIVTVFRPAEAKPPPEIKAFADALARTALHHADLISLAAIERYFREVYWQKGDGLDRIRIGGPASNERRAVLDCFKASVMQLQFAFRTVGDNFRLIDSGLAPVIVAIEDEAKEALAGLRGGWLSPGAAARRLQPFIVQVPPRDRDRLMKDRDVAFADGEGQFAVLKTERLYTAEEGLVWEDEGLGGSFII